MAKVIRRDAPDPEPHPLMDTLRLALSGTLAEIHLRAAALTSETRDGSDPMHGAKLGDHPMAIAQDWEVFHGRVVETAKLAQAGADISGMFELLEFLEKPPEL